MGKKILVVEDEQLLRNAIKLKLERSGYEVITAATVDEGLDKLKENGSVDLIWLDHYLPGGKDGLDFMDSIRSNSKFGDVTVFLVSNTASADKIYNYMNMGLAKYFVKAEKKLTDIIKEIPTFA